jgi:opacity protein-like surface antigen
MRDISRDDDTMVGKRIMPAQRGQRLLAAGAGLMMAALGASAALSDGERHAGGAYKGSVAAYAGEPSYSSWTGPYIGMGVGSQTNFIDWTTVSIKRAGAAANAVLDSDPRSKYDSNGLQFNGFAGYNFQTSSAVFGIEGGLSGAGDSTSKTRQVFPGANNVFGGAGANTFDHIKAGSGFGATLRGRAGVLLRSHLLMYVTGGFAYRHLGFTATCDGSTGNASACFTKNSAKSTSDQLGWTIGAGAEAQLTKNWFARIEYAYSDFGSETQSFNFAGNIAANAVTMTANTKLETQTATLGVAYKF